MTLQRKSFYVTNNYFLNMIVKILDCQKTADGISS